MAKKKPKKRKQRVVSCVIVKPVGLAPREVCFSRKSGEVTSNRKLVGRHVKYNLPGMF